MKNDALIKRKIEAVLDSFDNIEQAIPSPYFYTKVLAKLSKSKVMLWEKWSAFFLRPSIAFATICVVIIINAFVLYSKIEPHAIPADQVELTSSDEYSESITALYDLENIKP